MTKMVNIRGIVRNDHTLNISSDRATTRRYTRLIKEYAVLLPKTLSVDDVSPRISRQLRLGIVGGGRIARTQAAALDVDER